MNNELTPSDIKKMEDEIEYRVHIVRKKALDDVKEARAKEKKFWDKMFNVKESNTSSRGVITPGEQVGNLQRNMNNAADFQKRNNINNIVKKWK